jgi:hypothetical protein
MDDPMALAKGERYPPGKGNFFMYRIGLCIFCHLDGVGLLKVAKWFPRS